MVKRRRAPRSTRAPSPSRRPAEPDRHGRRRSLVMLGAMGLAAAALGVGVVVGSLGTSAIPDADLGSPATLGPLASLVSAPGAPTADPQGRYPAIGGITCDSIEHTGYHIHAHLELRFGGEVHAVPADIGIRDTCVYWLHTRRDSGVIHVEAEAARSFTLGDFFMVWGQVLTDRQVLDRPLEPTEAIFVFVNGDRYEGNPGSVELRDLEPIELQVGTAPFQPLPYVFPADLD